MANLLATLRPSLRKHQFVARVFALPTLVVSISSGLRMPAERAHTSREPCGSAIYGIRTEAPMGVGGGVGAGWHGNGPVSASERKERAVRPRHHFVDRAPSELFNICYHKCILEVPRVQ